MVKITVSDEKINFLVKIFHFRQNLPLNLFKKPGKNSGNGCLLNSKRKKWGNRINFRDITIFGVKIFENHGLAIVCPIYDTKMKYVVFC